MSSKAIHFSKRIDECSLQKGVLRMPRRFVSKHWINARISNPVALLLPGERWKVTWKKHGSDVIMFGDHWKEFTEFYSLDVEHSLWFSFRPDSRVRGTQFNVRIHESGLEIKYPGRDQESTDSGEESDTDKSTDDDDENENENEVHGSSRRQKKRENSPLPFSGSSKKKKNNPKEGHRKSYHRQHAGTESQRVMSENNTNPKKTGKRGISQAKGGWSEEEPLKDSRISSADKAVSSSENVIIRCTMHRSYIERNTMSMPGRFVPAHLHKEEGNAILWVAEKSWDVRFKLNQSSNQFSLTTGWKKFQEENTLKKGDKCVLTQMNSEKLSYSVEIERAKRASSPHLVQEAEKRKQTRLQSNLAEGSGRGIAANVLDNDSEFPKMNSKRENQFTITLKNTHMNEMKIPLGFIKKYVTDKVTSVVLRAKGRKWDVQLSYDPKDDSTAFSSGWSEFVRECHLKEGDQCVFDLVDKENFVLEVKASRCMF